MEKEHYDREQFIQVLIESGSCDSYEEACEIADRYENALISK